MKALTKIFHFVTPEPEAAPPAKASPATRRIRAQSPEQMLKILKNAELRKKRVEFDPITKNLITHDSTSANTPWGFFKTLFSKKPVGIENRDEIVGAVIEKMKDHVRKSTKHVDQVITEFLPDLGLFAQTGEVGELQNQWARLENILQQGIENFKRQQESRQESSESPSATTIRSIKDKPVATPQKPIEAAVLPRDHAEEADAAARISEVNSLLPSAMPAITRAGETVSCTLTVPATAHAEIFRDLREWDVHQKKAGTDKDDYDGLSEAFFKDSNRTTYVFDTDGFPVECERDREAVAIGFKQAAGPHPSRQLILSHLLGQESLKSMLELIQNYHPRRDGLPFILGGDSSPDASRNRIHMTNLANGDVEVDFLSLQKAAYLAGDNGLIPVNRSEKFNGPPSPDNAGLCVSMKIRVSGASLKRQQMDFTIVKPLTAVLQVEIPEKQPQ